MGNVLNEITEILKIFYRWPAVFVVEFYKIDGSVEYYVNVLKPTQAIKTRKGITLWYIYEEPIGNVVFALLYEGVKEISEHTELRLVEATVKYVKSRKIVYTFLGDADVQYLYKVRPTEKVIKIYAAKKENDVVFTDVSQLKQFIEMRLQCWLQCRLCNS
jgi:hypothetical protein